MLQNVRLKILAVMAFSVILAVPVLAGFVGYGRGSQGGSSGAHLANLDADANKQGWLTDAERDAAAALGYLDIQSDADMWAAAKGRSVNNHPASRSSTQLTTGSGTTNISANQYATDCTANHAAACDTLTKAQFSAVKASTDAALDLGFSSDQSYGDHVLGGHTTSNFPAADWENCYTDALTGASACPMDKDGYTAFGDIRAASDVCTLATSKMTDFFNGNSVTNSAFDTSDLSALTSAEADYLCDCLDGLSDQSLTNMKNCAGNATANALGLHIVKGVKEGTYAASNITSSLLENLGVYGTTDTALNRDMFEGNYCAESDGTQVNCLTHIADFIDNYSNASIHSSASSFKSKVCTEMSARVQKRIEDWNHKKHYYVEACQGLNLFGESDFEILSWPTVYKSGSSDTPYSSSYTPGTYYHHFGGVTPSGYTGIYDDTAYFYGIGQQFTQSNLNAFKLVNGQFKYAIFGNVTQRREHRASVNVTFKNTACIKHKGNNHPYWNKYFPISILRNEDDFDVNPLALGTLAASASTMTINLASAASSSVTAGTYTAVEDTETDFEKGDFLSSNISGVKIIAASSITGSLEYDGTAVTDGQVIRAHKLDDLTYTPASGATASSNYASFTYKTYAPFASTEFKERGFACNACAAYGDNSVGKPSWCWVNSSWYGGTHAGAHNNGQCMCTDAQLPIASAYTRKIRREKPGCTGWDNHTGYSKVHKYIDASTVAPSTPEALVRDAQCGYPVN